MTSSIVHDLRGPLVSVVGFAELAQMTATKAGHGTLGEQLGTVIAEAQRVARMVQEVLDFARGGATTLQRRAVPLRAFLDPIAGALRETVESLGIEIVVDHDPDERLALSLDKDRMHRVIENLVKNAREALSGKGMDAYGKHIWIATRKGGETVTIRVADDGPGIPEEVREKLFTPFASHGKEKGTGLGLATVRNLVLAHGGQVHVESPAPEGGAAFVLTFPAMQAAAKKPRPHAESAPASQPSPPADVAATA
jgi:signal transduction histidine kinase